MTFEHLDDPAGFIPDAEFRAATRRDGRRRRTRRRMAFASGSVLSSLAVLVAAVGGYGLWRTSQVDRVEVEFAAPPADLDGPPFNILLVGSDERTGSGSGAGDGSAFGHHDRRPGRSGCPVVDTPVASP